MQQKLIYSNKQSNGFLST